MFPEAVDDEAQRRALQPPCGDSFQMAELLEDGGCCVPASQSVYHPACSGRVSGGTVEIRLNVGETVLNASESDLLEGCAESLPCRNPGPDFGRDGLPFPVRIGCHHYLSCVCDRLAERRNAHFT